MIEKREVVIAIVFFLLGISLMYAYGINRIYPSPRNTESISQDSEEKQSVNQDLPECIIGMCPEYSEMDVDGDFRSESVVRIPTAMTQGAGKVWIIDEGKLIFNSGEMPGIGIKQLPDGNGFILSYRSPRDENMNSENFEIKYIFENGKFIEQK